MITHYDIINFYGDIKKLCIPLAGFKGVIYGVPRGGIPLAIALSERLKLPITNADPDTIKGNVLIVDDVIDSGHTRLKYKDYMFACLHKKKASGDLNNLIEPTFVANPEETNDWIEYWWEGDEAPAEDAIIRMIQAIGDNPNREGMKETPKRVIKSWGQLFCGYEGDPKKRVINMFKQFSSDGYDELVLLKDIEFFSFCEHHMLPFFGKAHIAYIPKDKVVGISKLARLLDIHSRRFQIQERIGELVTKDIMTYLGAQGAACIIEAQHLCMKMRGVSKQHSIMTTSSMKGAFLNKPAARAELMSLIK